MRRKKSFLKEMLYCVAALTAALVAVLLIFLAVSYSILEEEINVSSEGFLQIYNSELNNSVSKMDGILRNITAQGEDLYKIQSDDEKERVLASISLQKYMTGILQEDSEAGAVIIYDSSYGICLDAVSSNLRYEQKKLLRAFAQEVLELNDVSSFTWMFVELEERTYLCKVLKTEYRTIMVCADTENLLSALADQDLRTRTLLLVDQNGWCGKTWGEDLDGLDHGYFISEVIDKDYFVQSSQVAENQLKLYCYTGKQSVFSQLSTGTAAVAVFVLLSVVFALFLLRYVKKEVVNPMQEVIGDLEIIGLGDYERRITGQYRTHEFCLLKDTMNQMVDEIVGLKIQTYEKRLELQDVELKSIRLQLKPHFFLNALNTISSLGAQEKYKEIRMYISALSRNVRYMFRAGFHTVPIEEELRHVDHYLDMQEMKYPDCVFYLCELPENCRGWRIPQMLIHTFIENEYKHAVAMGEILTVLVKIKREIYHGEEMLLIEIEDDGKGYPEEVLNYINEYKMHTGEPGTQVGLWSIRRMFSLMYEREDLIQLSNTEPHGCLNRIRIPKQPIRELPEDRERGSGIYA